MDATPIGGADSPRWRKRTRRPPLPRGDHRGVALLLLLLSVAACASPEATRTRGGGPGADVGNRARVVAMHEGAQPFWKTPNLITAEHPSLEPARQADALSRQ